MIIAMHLFLNYALHNSSIMHCIIAVCCLFCTSLLRTTLTISLDQMFIENVKAYYDAARRPAALSSLCNCIRYPLLRPGM